MHGHLTPSESNKPALGPRPSYRSKRSPLLLWEFLQQSWENEDKFFFFFKENHKNNRNLNPYQI